MSFSEKRVPPGADNAVGWPVHDPDNRENRLREDLTRRLTISCAGLSGPDFEALVQQMTTEQLRGERVMTRNFGSS